MTVVYILGIIFLGIMGITYIDSYMKIQKEKIKASRMGDEGEVMKELKTLKQENAELKRRIENLEAIVVEEDMKLMTGLEGGDKPYQKDSAYEKGENRNLDF